MYPLVRRCMWAPYMTHHCISAGHAQIVNGVSQRAWHGAMLPVEWEHYRTLLAEADTASVPLPLPLENAPAGAPQPDVSRHVALSAEQVRPPLCCIPGPDRHASATSPCDRLAQVEALLQPMPRHAVLDAVVEMGLEGDAWPARCRPQLEMWKSDKCFVSHE